MYVSLRCQGVTKMSGLNGVFKASMYNEKKVPFEEFYKSNSISQCKNLSDEEVIAYVLLLEVL